MGRCAEPITQPWGLKDKVTVQGRKFEPWILCPLDISFTPGRIFFLFWSNVCLSEMMCRTRSLTMQTHKVTVQGHGFEPWILCPLCISFTPRRIFSKLCSNFHLSGTMCRTHNSPADLRSRSQLKVTSLSLEFGVSSISPLPLEGFSLNVGQMFASLRWCAEPITQLCWLKVKVTI